MYLHLLNKSVPSHIILYYDINDTFNAGGFNFSIRQGNRLLSSTNKFLKYVITMLWGLIMQIKKNKHLNILQCSNPKILIKESYVFVNNAYWF